MRTALVTGANGGIGSALVTAFTEQGYRVLGLDQQAEDDSGCSAYTSCDLERCARDESYLAERIAEVEALLGDGGLNVLVNNAALQLLGRTDSVTSGDWQRVLNTNVVAPFLLLRDLLAHVETVKGSVVNITSIHAHLTKPGFALYATSKSALEGLTRALAVDLGGRVRVNAIAPAATATPMLLAGFSENPALLEELGAAHPLGRIARPEEIANVAVFLASAEASFMSGSGVTVDGGIGARLHDPA